jgi:hypothetical protein
MDGLTKKQEKEFVRIHSGSLILYFDLDFVDPDGMTNENLERVQKLRTEMACKILKGSPSFRSTDEIIDYVKKHY